MAKEAIKMIIITPPHFEESSDHDFGSFLYPSNHIISYMLSIEKEGSQSLEIAMAMF